MTLNIQNFKVLDSLGSSGPRMCTYDAGSDTPDVVETASYFLKITDRVADNDLLSVVYGDTVKLYTFVAGTPVSVTDAEAGPSGSGVNVKRFGAEGDGTTDDATAIQAAIDALGTDGGMVFFPDGRYVLGTTLTIPGRNIHLVGTGNRNIQAGTEATAGGTDVLTTIEVAASIDFVDLDHSVDIDGFKCRDMTIIGPQTGTRAQYCFNFNSDGTFRRDFLFERLSIQRFESGFHISGASARTGVVKIQRCNIMHNDWAVNHDSGALVNQFIFTNNEAGQNGADSGKGGINIDAVACVVSENLLEGQRDAVKVYGAFEGVDISKNYFEANIGDFLINVGQSKDISILSNSDQGSHTTPAALIKVDQCHNVLTNHVVWPDRQYLTPEQSLQSYTPTGTAAFALDDLTFVRYAAVTDPHPQFFKAPEEVVTAPVLDNPSLEAIRDPFNPNKRVIGNYTATAALTTFTWTGGAPAFSSGDIVVVSFLMRRVESKSQAPYVLLNINNSGANPGSTQFPFSSWFGGPICRRTDTYLYTFAVIAGEDDNGASVFSLQIYPYGIDDVAESWAVDISVPVAYVVDQHSKIVPYIDYGITYESAAAPAGGTWVTGDRIWDSAPAAGAVGFVCTAGGTPGTWAAF